MAVTVASSGTQSATVGTEHSLYAASAAGVYVLQVNLTNLAAADVVELRIYSKTLSGDTITLGNAGTLLYIATVAGAVDAPVLASVPITAGYAATFSLKQTAGTGRSFPWAVLSL